MRQELDAITCRTAIAITGQLLGLFVEYFDEQAADDLPLSFGIRNAFELAEKTLGGIHPDHSNTEITGEDIHHCIAFAISQQAVIDEYANQLIADGLVK